MCQCPIVRGKEWIGSVVHSLAKIIKNVHRFVSFMEVFGVLIFKLIYYTLFYPNSPYNQLDERLLQAGK